MSLVILTGASGAGKTSIAKEIEKDSRVLCLFFDSIGVPAIEEMIAKHGSPENWQRWATIEWMRQIQSYESSKPILFEGQARIAFLTEALSLHPVENSSVVLVDCDDLTRTKRLSRDRKQPELATEQMMNWAAFLRREAQAAKITIVDTSTQSLGESVDQIKELLGI